MRNFTIQLLGLAGVSYAQAIPSSAQPTFSYKSFSYTVLSTERFATPVPSPLTYSAYAPAFSSLSSLLPLNATTTTYALQANATDSAVVYGQSAYSALWDVFSYNTSVPFTTTVSPTPVATSELVYPPPTYVPFSSGASTYGKLPSNFIWGIAGSPWQMEGGFHVEGRGPAGLDSIGALPDTDGSTPPVVTAMNYFLYKQDILRLAAIGMEHYSFGISWPRVVPFGVANSPINQEALDHYDDLINVCIENGITPIVTLVHFDYPLNAPTTSDTFIEDYEYYAKQVLTRFADRVPIWITFNEPNNILGNGWSYNTNVLIAHANIYNFYKSTLNATGQMTLKLADNAPFPLDPSNPNDTVAAERYQDYSVGILGDPLFLGLNYPDSVLSTLNETELAPLTDNQLALINGTMDFLSIDPYVTQLASAPAGGIDACAADPTNALWPVCVELTYLQTDNWLIGDPSDGYTHNTANFLPQALGYIWNRFQPSGIMVTEFGFPNLGEVTFDIDEARASAARSHYFNDFVEAMRVCVWEEGINIIGALAWSFVDDDEFGDTTQRFGLQTYNTTTFERQYKRAIFDFVDVMRESID